MTLPTVAIVGRPNVGKSSLFNRLIGAAVAIIDARPGVTRDRILHEVNREPWRFDLVDTAGIGIVDEAVLAEDVELQIERAIGLADRIIFLCDVRTGPLALDQSVAARLRRHAERVTVAVNKCDHDGLDPAAAEFVSLGLGEPVPISAAQGRGITDLLDTVCAGLPNAAELEAQESAAGSEGRLKICLAGRRNVGKSSLTNALCGEARVIVSDHAGTTRDAVDVALDHAVGRFLVIDTAGLRKKKQLEEDLEFYAACRTERGIQRADVVMLVLDASDEVGTVDKKLAHFCEVEGKPTVLVLNKWDLAEAGGANRTQYETWLRDRLPGLRYAPIVDTCALNGRGLPNLLKLCQELHAETNERVSTAELNKLIEAAVSRRRPKRVGGGSTKLYYATQAETSPPTIIVFVNRADWVEPGYSRYLENFLRAHLPFRRVPLRIIFKARESKFHEQADEHPVTRARAKADRTANLILPKGRRK